MIRRKLHSFATLPASERALLIEAGAALVLGAALALLPMKTYAAWLGVQGIAADRRDDAAQSDTVRRVGWAIRLIAGRVPFRSDCLPQALAARVLLGRRRIPITVYLGASLRQQDLTAHAWTQSCGVVLTGNGARRGFTMVANFTTTTTPPNHTP